MSKKIILAFFVIILITACTSQTTGKKTQDVDVRVGFEGLVTEFLKNTPPQKVFEDDKFPAVIRVGNKGAYTLDNDNKAILSLGYEKDYTKTADLFEGGRIKKIQGTGTAASFDLEGISKINLKGQEEVVSYNLQAAKIDPQSESHSSTVIATLCYPYETVLSSTVCVDTDVNNILPIKKACKAQDLTLNSGQGAPIAITKVEVSMLPAEVNDKNEVRKIKPQFLIFIENKGRGTAVKRDVISEFCTKSDTTHENLNRIYVKAFLSNDELDCKPKEKEGTGKQGFVKLNDRKEIVRCTLENGIDSLQDPYLSPLKIMLTYGYTQSISASYLIQKAAR